MFKDRQDGYEMVTLRYLKPEKGVENTSVLQQSNYIANNTFHVKINLDFGRRKVDSFRTIHSIKEKTKEKDSFYRLSSFDWYVHTSWLKDIHKVYSKYVGQMEEGKRQKEYHYPIVNLITKTGKMRNSEVEYKDSHTTEHSYADTQIHIEKSVQLEDGYKRESKEKEIKTIYTQVNMGNILDKVHKDIEEKLRYERLRKGLF